MPTASANAAAIDDAIYDRIDSFIASLLADGAPPEHVAALLVVRGASLAIQVGTFQDPDAVYERVVDDLVETLRSKASLDLPRRTPR